MEKLLTFLENLLIVWGPKVLAAIIILFAGLRIISWITGLLGRSFQKRGVDPSVFKFLISIVSVLLKVMLLLTVASQIGIPTTSFVAIISASALAVGMALSGNLSHFASGVLILIFKPYKVGDLVKIGEFTGTVAEIQIFNTILLTDDRKKVILPNSTVTSGAIVNISAEGSLRCDLTFAIDSEQDIDEARRIILDSISANDKTLTSPQAAVFVNKLSDNSVELVAHAWIHPDDYWHVFHGLQEDVKKSFGKAGIVGPQNSMNIVTVTR